VRFVTSAYAGTLRQEYHEQTVRRTDSSTTRDLPRRSLAFFHCCDRAVWLLALATPFWRGAATIEGQYFPSRTAILRIGRESVKRIRSGAALSALAMGLAACATAPPTFSVEPIARAAQTPEIWRSLYVGHASTPPPGHYRFARVYEDGRVQARELYAVNGPGPWLTYEGDLEIPVDLAREVFQRVDAVPPTAALADGRDACVLALASPSATTWRGCAYPDLAAHVLAIVPHLGPPGIAPSCTGPVCQIRLVEEAPALTHDRYGTIRQDLMLDSSGSFWCAIPTGRSSDQPNTLRVVQGRIRSADAPAVWQWLIGEIAQDMHPLDERSQVQRAPRLQTRGVGADWTTVAASRATALASRWAQIAPHLPVPCRR
jgi:hypothetical protein